MKLAFNRWLMKRFSEFIREQSGREGIVIYHFDASDHDARRLVEEVLTEAKKSVDLGQGKCIIHHKAHIPDGQDHLHFEVRGRTVYAVNKDGTAHDRSHGKTMQRWALDGAAAHYPTFKMPPGGLIEEILGNGKLELLTEGVDESKVLIPKARRLTAELAATGD
jgi:hypothetical protein